MKHLKIIRYVETFTYKNFKPIGCFRILMAFKIILASSTCLQLYIHVLAFKIRCIKKYSTRRFVGRAARARGGRAAAGDDRARGAALSLRPLSRTPCHSALARSLSLRSARDLSLFLFSAGPVGVGLQCTRIAVYDIWIFINNTKSE